MKKLLSVLAAATALLLANGAEAQVGVVLMHGKWGTPDRGSLEQVEESLRGAGFLVMAREMAWSDRRAYDASWDDSMVEIERQVGELRARGAHKIVVGGQSFGANVALGFGARHADVAGVIAISPGHVPERFVNNREIVESVAKARAMVAAGRDREFATFHDVNQGRERDVSARPSVYLSYFAPDCAAIMPTNTAHLSPNTALLWIVGTSDPMFREGRGYAFDRAPANPHSRYETVEADHFGAPGAARGIVVEWVKGLP